MKTLINSLPGIVFYCTYDANLTIKHISEGCCQITGYSPQELLEINYNQIIHGEDFPRLLEKIKRAIALEQSYAVEYRIQTKSGEEKWVWEKGSAVYQENGEIDGIEGFITDITKLKQAENLLAAQNQILEKIASNAPLKEILTAIIGKIEQESSRMLAAIWLLDQDRKKLYNGAAPSLPDSYVTKINGLGSDPTLSPCGLAINSLATVIVKDIAKDPEAIAYRDLALSHGIESYWSTPIFSSSPLYKAKGAFLLLTS